jgi:anti-sigma regulatory factor (Ser/Thr protein kinase)
VAQPVAGRSGVVHADLDGYGTFDWLSAAGEPQRSMTTPRPDTAAAGGDGRTAGAGGAAGVLLDLSFAEPELAALRDAVAALGFRAGLANGRVQELVLIAHELAVNAIRHGGGSGRLRLTATASAVYCEVTDDGPGLPDGYHGPPARPSVLATSGRGLWLIHTLAQRVMVARHGTGGSGTGGTSITAVIGRSGQEWRLGG